MKKSVTGKYLYKKKKFQQTKSYIKKDKNICYNNKSNKYGTKTECVNVSEIKVDYTMNLKIEKIISCH